MTFHPNCLKHQVKISVKIKGKIIYMLSALFIVSFEFRNLFFFSGLFNKQNVALTIFEDSITAMKTHSSFFKIQTSHPQFRGLRDNAEVGVMYLIIVNGFLFVTK